MFFKLIRSLAFIPHILKASTAMVDRRALKPGKPFISPEYIMSHEDNTTVRFVKPYVQEFQTYAKGRWLGRELIEILTREFGGYPPDYFHYGIKHGHILINNELSSPDYRIKNNDLVFHRAHRHENPVMGEIKLVGNTETLMAVNKPSSLPMHPCGNYRHNSLEFIMKYEKLIPDQPNLHLFHRLDRVTSGLVVLAKSKEIASAVSKDIRNKSTKKTYLARVKGKFPAQLSHLRQLESIDFNSVMNEDDDDDSDEVKGTSSANSDVKRKCDTDTMDNVDSSDKLDINAKKDRLSYKQLKKAKFEKKLSQPTNNDIYGKGEDVKVEDLPPRVLPSMSIEEVGASPNVGYKIETTEINGVTSELLWLQCPIQVRSHRDGIHGCYPDGKQSISSFKNLGYCEETDTTLVECNPYTGRTHQLRLHLQFLGNPIANDPCYGGKLFYADPIRRNKALEVLKDMKRTGSRLKNKIPHFNDPELDEFINNQNDEVETRYAVKSEEFRDEDVVHLEGESAEDFLIRTCRFCRNANCTSNMEYLLHCDGIWLHALRYTGKDWSFETEYPDWAEVVVNKCK